MKRICLITHCEASHTVSGKVGGWFNSELTERGKQQAAELPSRLIKLGFDIEQFNVYSSDLKRAQQTADILTKNTSVKPLLDHRLREMSFGSHGGIDQHVHQATMVPVSPTGNRLDHAICDGAETRRELAMRITEFITEAMQLEQDAMIVTHGFAATFVIAAFQQIEISSMGYISYSFKPGSISILEEDDLFKSRTVRLLNT